MSKSFKQFLDTGQHDANVISPVVKSSDETGQINYNNNIIINGDNSYDESAKRVSENLETSSICKQKKRKINSPSSSPEIVKSFNKKTLKEAKVKARKKEKVAFLILIFYIQFII